MISGQKIAVVIPAYRVEREVGSVITAVPAAVDRIFVVDDRSPDDVAAAVSRIGDARVTLLRHEKNRGVGGATVTGMLAAIEDGCDVVVKVDGDGQMDPAEIPLLIGPIVADVADHVKGSRFHHVRELRTMPKRRLIGNIGLTFLTKLASGYWNVLDPVNGFFATRASTLDQIPLRTLAERYFFETDLLIRLNIVDARVTDVALPARYGQEQSSLSVTRTLVDFPPKLMFGLLRRIFWRYFFYDISPVSVFALLGTILVLFGGMFGAYQWVAHYNEGENTPLGTIMIAVLPLLVGFQLLLQALVLDIQNTPRPGKREWQDHRRLPSRNRET